MIIITSEEEPGIQQQFEAYHVSAYIIKADFERGNLVMAVKRLLGA